MAKPKKSFNLLDVLIVLAALCLIAGIFWREELTELVERHDKENTVSIACNCTVLSVDDNSKALLPDDIVEVYYEGVKVGAIIPSVVADEDESLDDGSSANTTGKILTQNVAISFTAVEENSGYYINGIKLVQGEEYLLYTDLYEFTVRIDRINDGI